MDMAWKGLESLLKTTHKVHRSSTTTVFRLRLATDDSHWYIKFCPYWYPTTT